METYVIQSLLGISYLIYSVNKMGPDNFRELRLNFMKPVITKPSWENCPDTWHIGFPAIKMCKEGHFLPSLGNLVHLGTIRKDTFYSNL